MKSLLLIASLLIFTSLVSCEKTEGEGGTSSIQGKLYVVNLNSDGDTIAEYYGMDEDVYIIYGTENLTFDDKTSTSLDGSFTFKNLTPGEYTIFAYSECPLCPSGMEAIQTVVEITDKKQDIIIDDLIILE